MRRVTLGNVAPASRRRALALAIVLAAQCMFAMDLLIVVVALPRIQHDLGFNPASLSWVLNAFGLAFGGLLLLGGRLGDMLGQVRAFRIGLAVFVLGSLLGGLAQAPGLLIAARVLQGMGAALAGPSVLALVMVMARNAAEQARGMSLFIAVSSVGASAGLMLGGVLTEYLSWRWALLINVPVGVLVWLAIGRLVAETHPKPARLDVVGAVSATVFAISHVVPRLLIRYGARRLLAAGSVLLAASLAGFALLGSHASYFPAVLLPLLIHVVGIALVFAPGTVAIMHGVPDEHAGAASGLLQMDQQIGGALGIAVITSIYSLNSVPGHYAAGLPAAFGAGAGIALAAAGMAWGVVRGRSGEGWSG